MVSIGLVALGLLYIERPAAAEGLGSGGAGHQSIASSEGKGISFGSGGYSDGVAIDVPAGVAGHTPKLSLNIAPGTSDGPLGQNWSIGGMSQITRGSGSLGGVPESGSTSLDVYMLDGQVLHPAPSGGAWYETEHWNGAKVEYAVFANEWTVTKDGYTSTYGYAVAEGPAFSIYTAITVRWMLTQVEDPFGNTYTYSYSQPTISSGSSVPATYGLHSGEVLLDSITWGSAELRLHYEERPANESSVSYRGGRQEIYLNRLDSVEVVLGGQRLNWYELEYLDDLGGPQGRSRLAKIWQIDPSVSWLGSSSHGSVSTSTSALLLREVDYHLSGSDSWADSLSTGATYTSQIGRTTSNWSGGNQILLSPALNGDAFSDLLLVEYSCSTDIKATGPINHAVLINSCSAPTVKAWMNSGVEPAAGFELFDGYEPVFDSADPIAADYVTMLRDDVLTNDETLGKGLWSVVDLDGDGRAEIVDFAEEKIHSYSPVNCGGVYNGCWSEQSLPSLESVPGFGNYDYGWVGTSFSDIDGDGLVDIVQRPLLLGPDVEIQGLSNYDYYYGEESKDRNESYWYRNLGDLQFSGKESALEVPLEDPARYSADFIAFGCGGYPMYDFPTFDSEEFLESRGRLGDYNGDGLADVAYSFYCISQDSHQEKDY